MSGKKLFSLKVEEEIGHHGATNSIRLRIE